MTLPLPAFILALLLPLALVADAQTPATKPTSAKQNLVPNGDFSAADPLQSWRIDFPYEGWYVRNKTYISITAENAPKGSKCVKIELPPGIAGNEGGKVETAFIPAEPGATYRVDIDCLTWDFSAKTHVEAWVTDPAPIPQPAKMRVPASADHPALVMCYRAQNVDAKASSKQWQTVGREFTIPKTVRVGGQEMAPEFLSVKAFTFAGTPNGGKCYFANFRLYKIKEAQ